VPVPHPTSRRVGLGLRHRERRRGGVQADDVVAAAGQQQRERAGPAPDVEDPPSVELLDQAEIEVQVAAVGVEGVVDGGQPRVSELGVDHDHLLPLADLRQPSWSDRADL